MLFWENHHWRRHRLIRRGRRRVRFIIVLGVIVSRRPVQSDVLVRDHLRDDSRHPARRVCAIQIIRVHRVSSDRESRGHQHHDFQERIHASTMNMILFFSVC